MSALHHNEPQTGLGPGEAHQRCLDELNRPYPDYQAAQLYATLSLQEAVRDVAKQLAELTTALVSS